jgi:hypothetical protein
VLASLELINAHQFLIILAGDSLFIIRHMKVVNFSADDFGGKLTWNRLLQERL